MVSPQFFIFAETMAKTKQRKESEYSDIATHLKSAKSVVFANFQGLKVKESDELREQCRKEQVYYVVGKKTLLRKALVDTGYEVDIKALSGGVSIMFGTIDEVAPAKISVKFGQTHEVMKIFGGILEGKFIDEAKVKALSALPSKQQLLGQLVGVLNTSISGFVNVLAGNLRGFVNVLNAVKEAKI